MIHGLRILKKRASQIRPTELNNILFRIMSSTSISQHGDLHQKLLKLQDSVIFLIWICLNSQMHFSGMREINIISILISENILVSISIDSDIIPYWKTETIEAMTAFRYKENFTIRCRRMCFIICSLCSCNVCCRKNSS